MLRKTALMFLILILGVSSLWATASEAGAIFLVILPGGAVGMAGAYTALDGDLWATYYNPAGLASMDRKGFIGQHANWLRGIGEENDMYFEYAAAGMPYKGGYLSLAIMYLNAGLIQAIDANGNLIAEYSPFDFAISLLYSRKLNENLYVGGGLKYIYCFLVPEWIMRDYFNVPGGGVGMSYALDAGVLYKVPKTDLSFGASIANLGPGLRYASSSTSDPLPITLRLGMSYKYDVLKNGVIVFTPSVDVVKVFAFASDEEINWDNELKDIWYEGGFQATYSSFFYLRAGYFYDEVGDRIGPTYGGGFKVNLGKSGAVLKIDISIDSQIYAIDDIENYRISFDLYY